METHQNILVDYLEPFKQLTKRMGGNNYMSITVKVQFRQKLYKLAPGISTLEQIDKEMKQRFPSLSSFQYFYQDTQVKNFTAIITSILKQGKSSIKLVAKTSTSSSISQLSDRSFFKYPESHNQSSISLLEQASSNVSNRLQVSLPSEFYVCYNCSGVGTVKQNCSIQLCTVCRGNGSLSNSHKYIQRLKQLYVLHFQPCQNSKNILKQYQTQINNKPQSSIIGIDKSYQVIVTQTTKKDKCQVGKHFTMRFQIKNLGRDWNHENIILYSFDSKQGRPISALKSGQKMQVELGPFVCRNEGVLEKTYMLCYKEGNNLIKFGHKFGFSVQGFKEKEVKRVMMSLRDKIRQLKMASRSSKSEQYLNLKLKSMGIDLMNLKMDDEALIDIIKQFK